VRDHWRDRTWRPFGRSDPYFAVLTHEAYRRENLDEDARARFFASGEEHMAWVMDAARRMAGERFRPRRVLDFGCGVGRVLIPLARGADRAVGVDVSPEMLTEARANVSREGLGGVEMVPSDDTLSAVTGEFDLVHAFITFQHIPPRRGERIAAALLARLAPGGVAALHFTYGRNAPTWRKGVNRLRRQLPGVNAIVNLVQGRAVGEPFMPMFEYRLERLAELYRARGCDEVTALLTDHGGHLGAMLVARVPGGA
jgi:SAM-dependent methyltransferase